MKPESLDKIGIWSEIKLEIFRKYSSAFTRLLRTKSWCKGVDYVDAFAGAGMHISKTTSEMIPGSPQNALLVDPPFDRIVLIDVDGEKTDHLQELCGEDNRVQIELGDCNDVLVSKIIPTIQYTSFRRALCVLDPYGIHGKTLRWETIRALAATRTFDVFLNFPLMDINRNTLRKRLAAASPPDIAAFMEFWGGDEWVDLMYNKDLFGDLDKVGTNRTLALGFQLRLKDVARFEFVPEPILMKNTKGGELYYLFFASHQPVAEKIIDNIFSKYRNIE